MVTFTEWINMAHSLLFSSQQLCDFNIKSGFWSCMENSADPETIISQKPANMNLHCYIRVQQEKG